MKSTFAIGLMIILLAVFVGPATNNLFANSKKSNTEFTGVNFLQIEDNCEDDKNTNFNKGILFHPILICFLETPIPNQVIKIYSKYWQPPE